MKVVGIDIDTAGVRVVRLERRFREFYLLGMESRAFTGPKGATPEEISEALSSLKQSGILEGDVTVAALPGDKGYLRVLEVPPTDAEKTALLVRNQLDGATPESFEEEAIFASQILRAAKGTPSRVLATVTSVNEVSELLGQLRLSGIDPQLITCEASALCALAVRIAPADGMTLVDVGYDRTTLVVVAGGSVILARTIKRGLRQISQKLARALGISVDEFLRRAEQGLGPLSEDLVAEAALPLAAEIRRTLLGLRAQGEVLGENLLVSGDGARVAGLPEGLARPLSMTPLPFDLSPLRLKTARAKGGQPPLALGESERFARALGLAYAGIERQKTISLRQGALAFKGDISQLAGQLVRVAALFLLLLSLAGLSSYARYTLLKAEREHAEEKLKQLAKEVTGKELPDVDAIEALLHGNAGAGVKPPWPETTAFDLLVLISEKLPKDIKVDINKLEIRAKKTTLSGEIDNAGDVDAIIAALKDNPCFKEFKTGSVKQITTRDGESRHDFTLNIDTTCP